jgi:hypothetical protein
MIHQGAHITVVCNRKQRYIIKSVMLLEALHSVTRDTPRNKTSLGKLQEKNKFS